MGGKNYYYKKSFCSGLLRGIVDTKCAFWDYEFGWAKNMHDWTLFHLTKVEKIALIKGIFLPYKLIKYCAYPVRP